MTAAGMERPWSWTRTPQAAAQTPSVLATDRSISPVMMISVIGSAISRIGAYVLEEVVRSSAGRRRTGTLSSE